MPYTPTLGRVIAMRDIDFIRHSGEVEPAVVSIGEPVQPEANGPWRCPYRVQTPSFQRTFAMAGEDSMQALILSLHVIGSELIGLAREHNGVFKQYGEDDLGFPDLQASP